MTRKSDPRKLLARAAVLRASAHLLLASADKLEAQAQFVTDPVCYCGHVESDHEADEDDEGVRTSDAVRCRFFDFGGDCHCEDFSKYPEPRAPNRVYGP